MSNMFSWKTDLVVVVVAVVVVVVVVLRVAFQESFQEQHFPLDFRARIL